MATEPGTGLAGDIRNAGLQNTVPDHEGTRLCTVASEYTDNGTKATPSFRLHMMVFFSN